MGMLDSTLAKPQRVYALIYWCLKGDKYVNVNPDIFTYGTIRSLFFKIYL